MKYNTEVEGGGSTYSGRWRWRHLKGGNLYIIES
jgi:hypothetical protein